MTNFWGECKDFPAPSQNAPQSSQGLQSCSSPSVFSSKWPEISLSSPAPFAADRESSLPLSSKWDYPLRFFEKFTMSWQVSTFFPGLGLRRELEAVTRACSCPFHSLSRCPSQGSQHQPLLQEHWSTGSNHSCNLYIFLVPFSPHPHWLRFIHAIFTSSLVSCNSLWTWLYLQPAHLQIILLSKWPRVIFLGWKFDLVALSTQIFQCFNILSPVNNRWLSLCGPFAPKYSALRKGLASPTHSDSRPSGPLDTNELALAVLLGRTPRQQRRPASLGAPHTCSHPHTAPPCTSPDLPKGEMTTKCRQTVRHMTPAPQIVKCNPSAHSILSVYQEVRKETAAEKLVEQEKNQTI